MNKIIKRLKGQENGQALILAIILLGVGALMLTPLLAFMGSGLNAGVIHEDKTDELYACDAGVQDAIWKINNRDEVPGFPPSYDPEPPEVNYLEYSIPDVNDNLVNVYLEYINPDNGGTFRVRSWVGGTITDNDTMIDAIITTMWLDYSGITNHVVTSQGDGDPETIDYEIDPKVDVEPPGEYDPDDNPHGAISDYGGAWPTPEALISWYSKDVEGIEPYDSDTICIEDEEYQPPPAEDGLGPLYRNGTIEIINTGAKDLTLKLNGTVYITGDTLIGTTNQNFILDLNGHTIFVESSSVGSQPALEIGGKCTLTGSGCIIAVGDIKFQPKMQADEDDYILVLSVVGTTTMFPSGTFYGTLAGQVFVDVKSGETPVIDWNDGPPDDLNFPGGGGGPGMIWGIHTWQYWKITDVIP